jgi:hypothetical protein
MSALWERERVPAALTAPKWKQKIENIRTSFGDVTTMSVDNAAKEVMQRTTKAYARKHPDARPILEDRDSSHSVDLLAKDSPKVPCFESLMADVNQVVDLVTVDRVNGIITELFDKGVLPRFEKVKSIADTRFNKTASLLKSVLAQKPFLDRIREVELFTLYYNSRDTKRKNKIGVQINIASPQFYERVKLAIRWFDPIER